MSSSILDKVYEGEYVACNKLPQAALVGGVFGAFVNVIILNVGRAFGTPFELMPPIGLGMEPLPSIVVVLASVVPAIAAAVLLAYLPRFTKRPFTAFWIISAVVLWLSTYGPSGTPSDSEATIMGLNLMHMMSAAAIVGAFSALARADEEQ